MPSCVCLASEYSLTIKLCIGKQYFVSIKEIKANKTKYMINAVLIKS